MYFIYFYSTSLISQCNRSWQSSKLRKRAKVREGWVWRARNEGELVDEEMKSCQGIVQRKNEGTARKRAAGGRTSWPC